MRLRTRVLLSLLAMVGLMAIPALYGLARVMEVRDIALEMREQAAQSALAIGELETALQEFAHYQRSYVAVPDEPEAQRYAEASLQRANGLVARLRANGYEDVVANADLPLAEMRDAFEQIDLLLRYGHLAAATDYLGYAGVPLVTRARSAMQPLAQAVDRRTRQHVAAAERSAAAATTALATAVLVAIILAIFLAFAVSSVLTRPLDRLRYSMARVAEGSFEAPQTLPYHRRDEVGELFRSFRAMTLRLAELDRLKAEFVGIASHDLKTPISVITGYAELMEEELSPELGKRHKDLLRSLGEQTQSLQRRVDQLLEISRMEAGRLRLGLEEIYIRHFADGLEREYEPAARARGLTFELLVHERVPPFLIADPDVLRSDVLGNLIGNALKFTPPGGAVSVHFRPDGNRLIIDVADTGPGIPAENMPHVFEKYWQGRGSRGGAGLGLAIARAAVEAHGGRLDVQSRVGKGSRFRVIVPTRATLNGRNGAPAGRDAAVAKPAVANPAVSDAAGAPDQTRTAPPSSR